MITGIIVALPDEISSLTKKKLNKKDCFFINKNTVITLSGAGPNNASIASQLLVQQGAERLISWGCAAALDADLKPGDLILPAILQTEEKKQLSISSPWLQFVIEQLSELKPLTGTLIESGHIVATSSEKKGLNNDSGSIALDMESVAIAKTAKKHKLPILVIRCIADPVQMNLPQAVNHALNKQGDVVLVKLLWFLLLHPSELPGLIKLGLHFNSAKNKLKLVAQHLDIIVGFE